MTEPETLPTDGVVGVGEVTTRVMREAITEPDFANARIAGAVDAYQKVILHAGELIRYARPYDDTRALTDLISWSNDRIREVHSGATNGIRNG